MAERTGLEPATPCVTGRYSNRLNYRSTEFFRFITTGCHPGLLQFDAWQFPTLTWGDPTLPSALRRFTSEFGMGSGGTTALVPPGKFFVLSTQFFIASAALPALVKSVTYFSMLLPFRRLSPCCCANYCVLNSESKLKILSIRQNIFGVVRLSLTVH